METKKIEENIFSSVVSESVVDAESNTVLVLHLVVVVTPVNESDVKGSGLNQ